MRRRRPTTQRKGRALLRAAAVLAIAALPLAGCKEVETETAVSYEPSKIEEVKGQEDLHRITFTKEAADRTGLKTEKVRSEGGRKVVPYAALIYDPEGKTSVYTSPKPLHYLREAVKVVRIDGDNVVVSDGPAVGTDVVTVGAAEVYGTELEIAASH